MNSHQHQAQHTTHTDGGHGYQVCDCGATRKILNGNAIEAWHTCELCTHPYGLAAVKRPLSDGAVRANSRVTVQSSLSINSRSDTATGSVAPGIGNPGEVL